MINFPEFEPHPFLRSGHAQTLVANWFPTRIEPRGKARRAVVELADGDRLILHDHAPAHRNPRQGDSGQGDPGDTVVLLVHGLAGCHRSGYMRRIAARLQDRGIRSFRLDLRGCGAGRGHARNPYHAGQSHDIEAAVRYIAAECPDAPIRIAGFSLGGSMVLKYLGEQGPLLDRLVVRAIAVNPPVDLLRCTENLSRTALGVYDRHFARLLCAHVRNEPMWSDVGRHKLAAIRPRRVIDFDDAFTAPMAGYRDARHYYETCSARQCVEFITVPTLILSAQDDPLIPPAMLRDLPLSPAVQLYLAAGGGHLGYIARRGIDPDCRWMDWRVVDWLTASTASDETVHRPVASQPQLLAAS